MYVLICECYHEVKWYIFEIIIKRLEPTTDKFMNDFINTMTDEL